MSRVLIVDDEKSIRRTLAEFLREDGHEVAEAEDADAALEHLHEGGFDIVVSDIILPRVTGVELLRRIREIAPEAKMVMMTGEPTVETASESLRAGATDYLFKPIDKAAIQRVVINAGRIKALEDDHRRLEAENRDYQENLERLVEERTAQWRASEAKLLRTQRLESIGSLASGIAHDLNNILAPIIMCAPLLRLHNSASERGEMADAIESSAQRAVGIVRQLLSFARGKDGQKESVQARHLIREMAKIARETFPRNIEVHEECAADLWPVSADATQIHQVLLNLCVNARDAMPSGGRLSLRARNVILDEHYASMHKEATPGPFLRLEVQDTGTGMTDAVREHVFESFFTTKDQDHGTGLGLTTVLGIVKDHGGFIDITTAPGEGTTFTIHLPTAAEAHTPPVEIASHPVPPRGGGELVLVVDDEETLLEVAQRTLERHGYSVIVAKDGIDAIAQVSAHLDQLRVVVTDVIMPFMDGVTLCRTLRRLKPALPVVVSSGGLFGSSGMESLRVLTELEIRQILHKPHNAEHLLCAVHEALHSETIAANRQPEV